MSPPPTNPREKFPDTIVMSRLGSDRARATLPLIRKRHFDTTNRASSSSIRNEDGEIRGSMGVVFIKQPSPGIIERERR